MVKVNLTDKERNQIVQMMEGSTIQLGFAEKGLALLKKFKEAKE